MGRNMESKSKGVGPLRKVAEAVKRVFARGRAEDTSETMTATPARQPQQARSTSSRTEPKPVARAPRRETDIPLDVLDRAYTPPATSAKASFRSDGADHQNDQEFSRGVAVADWKDEDHFTNKSGDPRIGTRGRTYEPNEQRAETRDEQR